MEKMYNTNDFIVTREELKEQVKFYLYKEQEAFLEESGTIEARFFFDSDVYEYIDYILETFKTKPYSLSNLLQAIEEYINWIQNFSYLPFISFYELPSSDKYLFIDNTRLKEKEDDFHNAYLYNNILKLIPLDDKVRNYLYSEYQSTLSSLPLKTKIEITESVNDLDFDNSIRQLYPDYSRLTNVILRFMENRLKYVIVTEDRWNKIDWEAQRQLVSGDYNYYLLKNLDADLISAATIASSWSNALESIIRENVYKKIEGNKDKSFCKRILDAHNGNKKRKREFTLGSFGWIIENNEIDFINFYESIYNKKVDINIQKSFKEVAKNISIINRYRVMANHGNEKKITNELEEYRKKLYYDLYEYDSVVKSLINVVIDLFIV